MENKFVTLSGEIAYNWTQPERRTQHATLCRADTVPRWQPDREQFLDIWIDFFQPSVWPKWAGSFDVFPTPPLNPHAIHSTTPYKVQLNDGRSGVIRVHDCTMSSHTGEVHIQFHGDGTLA